MAPFWPRQSSKWGKLSGHPQAELHFLTIEPEHNKTNKMTCAPSIHPVWSESSLCTLWVAKDSLFSCGLRTLIRLGGCPGWSVSSLGAQVTLLLLSCCVWYWTCMVTLTNQVIRRQHLEWILDHGCQITVITVEKYLYIYVHELFTPNSQP